MNILQRVVSALCSTALAAAPIAAPAFAVPVPASADEPWTVVPEETLRDMRGGIDLGALVANFAIMRVVEVDGVVVARMQIVISNLDRLGNGGMPTISLSGPSAELVQIMNAAGNPGGVAGGALNTPASGAAANTGTSAAANTGTSATATSAAAANIAPAALPAGSPPPESASVAAARPGSGTTASTPQVTSTTGNAGTVSATNTQSGSMAQFGSALGSAVAAANGGALQPSGSVAAQGTSSSAAPTSTPAASGLPASVAQNTTPQSSTSPQSSTAPSAAAPAAGTTQTVPLGSTGQVAVLSNLPNATALTTAIQNNVRAATIQVQTTISATLNSLALLNASSLASSIRQQVSKGP